MTPHSNTVQLPVVDIQLLGPLRVLHRGRELVVGTRREQALLALLVLGANRVQPAQRLVDQLWEGEPPEGAATTLRSYISHLRSNLGGTDAVGGRLQTRGSGYVLEVEAGSIDLNRFRTLVASGQASLRAHDHTAAWAHFEHALSLWRGQPLAELGDRQVAAPVLAELTELHTSAVEGRLSALVETGRHQEALPALESLVIEQPLREGARALQMLALYRDGRTPAALDVHRAYRQLLAEELGIDPSPRLDALYRQILVHDPTLELASSAAHGPSRSFETPLPDQTASDPVELATQLIASLQEVIETASRAAAEMVDFVNRDQTPRPHREPVQVALRA
jgi:DNA-binding SARP family transcriptional activator